MKHKSHHRGISIPLILLLFLLTLSPFAVTAASNIEIQTIWYSRGGVNWGTDTWGHKALQYMNGWDEKEIDHYVVFAAANLDYDIAYCAQPNIPLDDGDIRNSQLPDTFLSDYDNGALKPGEIETMLGRIFCYGYTGKAKTDFTNNQIAKVIATQVLVWEVIVGERGPTFNKITPPSNLDTVLDTVGKNHPLRSRILTHYETIAKSIQEHSTIPSFVNAASSKAATYEPEWNGTNYSITLIDHNGVLSGYDVSCSDSSISFAKSGNELKITSSKPIPKSTQVKLTRSNTRKAVTFWSTGTIKDKNKKQGLSMVGKNVSESLTGYFNLQTAVGFVELAKQGDTFASVTEAEGIYQPVYAQTGLTNAVFEIRAADDIIKLNGSTRYKKGTVITTITTDSSGIVKSPPLYLGKYELIETTAPENMVLDSTPIIVDLKQNGDTVTTAQNSYKNIRQKVKISLTKILEQNEQLSLGYGDEYKEIRFGLYAEEELTAKDGTTIPKDGVIEILSLSDILSATATTDLPHGRYYIQEIATDEHYILSDTKHPIEFDYQNPTIAVVDIVLNDGEPVQNNLYRGKIRGMKQCESGIPLEGVLFGLFLADEESFSTETAIQTCTTDQDGYFQFKDVFVGKYSVKELETLTGYVLSAETFEIEVKVRPDELPREDKQAPAPDTESEPEDTDPTLIEIPVITNEYTKIRIHKVDENGKVLQGAHFDLIDNNGKTVATWTTENALQAFDRLPIGEHYTILETKAPDGYEFALTRDFVVRNTADEQVITIENHLRPAIITPKTGDSRTNPVLLWVILAVSVGGIAFILIDKARKKQK